jgi:RimJ/RimL family protein N-acetyltransferase
MTTAVKTPDDLRTWANLALKLEAAGTGMPWITILKQPTILKSNSPTQPDRVVGSTRFIDLDLHHLTTEIGHTWIDPTLHRTGINPEAKLLQLTYAFETLHLRRVAFKTHHENLQSQAAIRKLGAQYEGTFRNHYIMPDNSARHSVWFAITAEDWPLVKENLIARLASQPASPNL